MKNITIQIVMLLVIIQILSCSSTGSKSVSKQEVTLLLEKQRYVSALDLVTKGGEAGHPLPGLEKEYITALNRLLEMAAQEVVRKNYAAAGQFLKRVMVNFPADPELKNRMKWPYEHIAATLNSCSSHLMEEGLMEYRKGNLNNALKVWKKLLAFNPEYKEAKKAIETTSTQLHSLQSLEKAR